LLTADRPDICPDFGYLCNPGQFLSAAWMLSGIASAQVFLTHGTFAAGAKIAPPAPA
jgi:hypothetical protein